jgi:hypothetical protein
MLPITTRAPKIFILTLFLLLSLSALVDDGDFDDHHSTRTKPEPLLCFIYAEIWLHLPIPSLFAGAFVIECYSRHIFSISVRAALWM